MPNSGFPGWPSKSRFQNGLRSRARPRWGRWTKKYPEPSRTVQSCEESVQTIPSDGHPAAGGRSTQINGLLGRRPRGQRDQGLPAVWLHRVLLCGLIPPNGAAGRAPVYEVPAAPLRAFQRDGFHEAAAIALPVSRHHVHVPAPQTLGTVIAKTDLPRQNAGVTSRAGERLVSLAEEILALRGHEPNGSAVAAS